MEKLPMDLMPGPGSDWKRRRREDGVIILENTAVDPTTGVTTTWSKDLKYFRESRTDRLPNSPLYRYISRIARPGTIPYEPAYVIEELANGLHKEINLEPNTPLLSRGVELYIADETVQDCFFAKYKGNKLHEIRIYHNSMDLISVYQTLIEQPLPENLQALAQLCRIEGVIVAFNPYIGPVHGELSADQKKFLDWMKDEPERKTDESMKAWSEEERVKAKVEVSTMVRGTVVEHLKNNYSQEEIVVVSAGLEDQVLGDLPFDYSTKRSPLERIKIIVDSLVSNVAMLLTSNRFKYEELGNFAIDFYFDQNDRDEVGVEVEDLEQEVIHRGRLRFGEQYRYQEHDYGIFRDSKDRVIATVIGILRPRPKLQISVPAEIDLQEFVRVIRLPESVGWEKALDVANIEYKKYV